VVTRNGPKYVHLLGPMKWTPPRLHHGIYMPPIDRSSAPPRWTWWGRLFAALLIVVWVASALLAVALIAAVGYLTIELVRRLAEL